jgi:hypothetical protein
LHGKNYAILKKLLECAVISTSMSAIHNHVSSFPKETI